MGEFSIITEEMKIGAICVYCMDPLFESDGRTPANYGKLTVCDNCKSKEMPVDKIVTGCSVLGDNAFLNESRTRCFYCEQPYLYTGGKDLRFTCTKSHVVPPSKNLKGLQHNIVHAHACCKEAKVGKSLQGFRVFVETSNFPFGGVMIRNIDRLIERMEIVSKRGVNRNVKYEVSPPQKGKRRVKPPPTELEISTGKYLTDKWICADNKTYILHIGPTCSGKTYNAIQKLKCSDGFGCYLAPLRLLAWEIAEKLNESGVKCDLVTGEERKYVEGACITSSTIEMLDYDKEFDVAVIDECFMIADKDRGKFWLKSILEVNAREIHLILNEESEQLISNILTKAKKNFEINRYERLTRLQVDMAPASLSSPKDKTAFIVFSRVKALMQKAQFEKRGYNVSILYGNLPPETKKEQIQKFISGENSICISTDVIGMGLNLPCEYVCFLEMEKFDGSRVRPLNSMEIKQIGGRAGRYGYSDVGYVSGVTTNHTKSIMRGLSQKQIIERAFWGIDYNIFKDIPLTKAVAKLEFFKEMNCIPELLLGLVKKQDLSPLIEIAACKGMDEFDISLQWALINAPVKKVSKDFFNQTITNIRSLRKIWLPGFLKNFHPEEITDTTMLGYYEQHTAEIDLFAYFRNQKATFKLIEPHEYDSITSIKQEIITRINVFLMDKRKSSIKHCESCHRELDISWPHKKCDGCFRGTRWREDYY